MKYIINDSRAKELFAQADAYLANIEVKGDSVINLYQARGILKNIFLAIEEIEDDDEKKPDKE